MYIHLQGCKLTLARSPAASKLLHGRALLPLQVARVAIKTVWEVLRLSQACATNAAAQCSLCAKLGRGEPKQALISLHKCATWYVWLASVVITVRCMYIYLEGVQPK